MDLTRTPDAQAAAERAAQVLAELAGAARTVRGRAHVCLAGGSTPMRSYDLLGPRLEDWTDIHLWYGDERCVPHDHPDSNHGQAIARLIAPGATWHPVDTALEPHAAAAAYATDLGDTVMDVTLLGIGPDGHTASLFPDHPLLDADGTVAAITDSPKPPPERVTLTLSALNASRRIVLLVTGADKAQALKRILAAPDRAVPASLLARERFEVVADEAALGG